MRIAVVVLLGVIGCASGPKPEKMWMDQYEGLRQIPDMGTRVNMLTNLIRTAAYAGDGAAVKRFLRDFEGDPRHDELAVEAVKYLRESKPEHAMLVAESIEDELRRETILADLRPKKNDEKKSEEAKP
jgi:hypothetical protein